MDWYPLIDDLNPGDFLEVTWEIDQMRMTHRGVFRRILKFVTSRRYGIELAKSTDRYAQVWMIPTYSIVNMRRVASLVTGPQGELYDSGGPRE